MNPYDWKRNQPAIEVQRPEAGPMAAELRRGGSGVLLAGRGMGKSVFLQQVQRELEGIPGVRAVLVEEPPADLSVRACLEALARSLGVAVPGPLAAREVVDAYRTRGGAAENLVLLFDELDRYAKSNGTAEPPGRHYFNSLESMRRNLPGVGILAAGSIGVFAFRDVLGSSFLARADKVRIRPFDRAAIATLARPFEERGAPLSETAAEALYLASGGNPALVTYGLGALWDAEAASEHAVAEAFVRFQAQNREFLRDFQLAFADPGLSQAPQKVWDLIRQQEGSVSRADLDRACDPSGRPLRLDVTDVLDILEAAGLVRVTGSMQADPVLVRPVTSLAVVMLTDAEIDDWPSRYRLECLQPEDLPTQAARAADLTGGARWRSTSRPPEGGTIDVDHLLLRLPRGW